jgi:hypothetical protein
MLTAEGHGLRGLPFNSDISGPVESGPGHSPLVGWQSGRKPFLSHCMDQLQPFCLYYIVKFNLWGL